MYSIRFMPRIEPRAAQALALRARNLIFFYVPFFDSMLDVRCSMFDVRLSTKQVLYEVSGFS
jgi:hypothetical protein